MAFLPKDIDAFNSDVHKWTKETHEAIGNKMDSLGIVHRENSRSPVPAKKALKASERKRDGVVNKISYRFYRHMVFVQKAVGRGVPISRTGQSNRKPKDWYNSVVESRMDELTSIVADHQGTMILNAISIK